MRLAALALALVPTALPAQEDRQETRLPPVAWEEDFIGLYGRDGDCEDPAAQWLLTGFSVGMGSVICNGLGKMTFDPEGLAVPLSRCRDGAIEVADRILIFERTPSSLTAITSDETFDLIECPGNYSGN